MRTTLTIDDDVALQIVALVKQKNLSRRELINDLLRKGIEVASRQTDQKKHTTAGRSLGKCYQPNLDDISDILAVAEVEHYS